MSQYVNKMAEFGAKVQEQLPEANLSTTGQWNGKQWYFLAEYSKGTPEPSAEVQERVRQIGLEIDPTATVFILEMGENY